MRKVFLGLTLFLFFGALGFSQTATVKKYAVALRDANVRSMPSTQGQILFVLHAGEKAEILEDLGTWIKVRRGDGVVGFVWSKLVRAEVEKVIAPAPKPVSPPKPAVPPKPTVSPSPSASYSQSARFGFSFNFTYALVNPEDFNANVKFINGGFNYDRANDPSLSIDHPLEELKHMMGGEVEGKFFLNPNFSVGLGFSYMTGSKTSDSTMSDPAGHYTKYSLDLKASYFGPYLSLAGHYPAGLVNLEAFAYGGYFFGSFSLDIEKSGAFTGFWNNDNMKKGALGFGGGLRIGIKFSPQAGFMLSGKYSYLKFTDIEGDYKDLFNSYHGTLYYVETNAPWEEKGVSQIFKTTPSGWGIVSARKAELNFSGFYLSAGFFLRF